MSIERYERIKTGPAEGELEGEDYATYSEWAKEAAWLMSRSQRNYFGNYITYLWADIAQIDPGATATRETTAYTLWRSMDLLEILTQ